MSISMVTKGLMTGASSTTITVPDPDLVTVTVDGANALEKCQSPTIPAVQKAILSVVLVHQDDEETPNPVDLSGATGIIFRLKDKLSDTAFLVEKDIFGLQGAGDLALGRVSVVLTAAEMDIPAPNRALWQVEYSFGDPLNPTRLPASPGVMVIQGAVA